MFVEYLNITGQHFNNVIRHQAKKGNLKSLIKMSATNYMPWDTAALFQSSCSA